MCSVYPGPPWAGASSGSWNHQSPDSTPSTLLHPRPAPACSRPGAQTLSEQKGSFQVDLRQPPSEAWRWVLAGLCDVTKDSEPDSRNTGPGRGSPPGSEHKSSPPRDLQTMEVTETGSPAGSGEAGLTLPPQEGLISQTCASRGH